MEFMMFYVNCGTQLEYYMHSPFWHRYNKHRPKHTAHRNNAQETRIRDHTRKISKMKERKKENYSFSSLAHAQHHKLPSPYIFYELQNFTDIRLYKQFSPFGFFLLLSVCRCCWYLWTNTHSRKKFWLLHFEFIFSFFFYKQVQVH